MGNAEVLTPRWRKDSTERGRVTLWAKVQGEGEPLRKGSRGVGELVCPLTGSGWGHLSEVVPTDLYHKEYLKRLGLFVLKANTNMFEKWGRLSPFNHNLVVDGGQTWFLPRTIQSQNSFSWSGQTKAEKDSFACLLH